MMKIAFVLAAAVVPASPSAHDSDVTTRKREPRHAWDATGGVSGTLILSTV
jgi:hypothetical protein